MVGEIRDYETAGIAVRAALTGHLLFSTLHTNNAVSAVGRLFDMGIEPFLLSSVLEGILAQRLGRKVCQTCRVQAPMPEETRHRLSPSELAGFPGGLAWKGAGCEKCGNAGMRGRVGFYEVVLNNGPMRQAMTKRATSQELLRLVGPEFQSMRRDGMHKAVMGFTTIDQVLMATQDADAEIAGL